MSSDRLKIAFYGDDFTGSTDALEFLSRAGLKTILFLENPSKEVLSRISNVQAIGIAGMTRAMAPKEMNETLIPAFELFRELNPRHVHYKVCSTFDSSPEIGNIGVAVQAGLKVFENEFVPILVAAPHLGRYSAFGNLYARMGIGSQGTIHRLDRHPSMSKHPITPADEADLRLHLGRQWFSHMGLMDLLDIEKPYEEQKATLQKQIEEDCKVIFFDAMYPHQMPGIGRLLDGVVQEKPLFSVGSSGVSKALGDFWANEEEHLKSPEWETPTEQKAILVLSGSCSPVTGDQIDQAIRLGFYDLPVNVKTLTDNDAYLKLAELISEILQKGQSVILHTCKGPDDDRVELARQFFYNQGFAAKEMRAQTAEMFGTLLGKTAREVVKNYPLQRLVIAGGDTSSYVARALGIEAVEMIAPMISGAPLCRVHSTISGINGLEVNIKGGQVGDVHYFENVRLGKCS